MKKEKKKIVIVEDDGLLAIILKKMAATMDFDVLDIVQSGEGAVHSIKKNQPDLVLMDIFLADSLTGIEAMKRVRKYSGVPVIYITAQFDFSIRREACDISNSFYMLKPIKMNEFRNALEKVQFAA